MSAIERYAQAKSERRDGLLIFTAGTHGPEARFFENPGHAALHVTRLMQWRIPILGVWDTNGFDWFYDAQHMWNAEQRPRTDCEAYR